MMGRVFILLGLLSVVCSTGLAMSDEHRLVKHLWENYKVLNPTGAVRPLHNASETLVVKHALAIQYVISFDRTTKELEVSALERYMWRDIALSWDPADFGGIANTRIPIQGPIWRPDITLYNSIELNRNNDDTLFGIVSSEGDVLFMPLSIKKVRCSEEDGGYWSSPNFTCNFKFGSWTYDGWKLDLNFYDGSEEIDMSSFYYMNMVDYQVLEYPAKKNVIYYACCIEPFPDLTYTFKFTDD